MTEKLNVDVIVSGAGATGWSFLLSLQHMLPGGERLSVALVDAFDNSRPQSHPGFDARALALSQQSLQYFEQLSFRNAIAEVSNPIHTIHVSDQGGAGQARLNHTDYKLNELGAVVEAQDLGKLLLDNAQLRLNYKDSASKMALHHFQPHQISVIRQTRDSIEATLDSGQQIQSKLLVLAEGSHSATSKRLNLPVSEEEYGQHAIITNVQTQLPHNNIAFERFTPSGPLAFLPMSSYGGSGKHDDDSNYMNSMADSFRIGVVWSVHSDELNEIMALDEQRFLSRMQDSFGYRLGRVVRTGKRQSYPLKLTRVNDSLASRVVCIGNASQTLHPIAGQGFNLAFRDAWQLAESIAHSFVQQNDLGDFKTLSTYKTLRQKDRSQTILFTDGLVRLFSNTNPLLQGARNLGLFALQHSPGLKQKFARMAMGQSR